jgi:hypothetical protein
VGGGRRGSEKKRRVKMADLRTLIETKILSKSDRGLEKIGIENLGANRKHSDHTVRSVWRWTNSNENYKFDFKNYSTGIQQKLGYWRETFITVSFIDNETTKYQFGQGQKYA